MIQQLQYKLQTRKAIVGVMGLGYVGLPLALAFSKIFKVIGYDPDQTIVNNLLVGKSHVMDVNPQELSERINQSFFPYFKESCITECDFILMCVPTPLIYEKEPDLSYIIKCSEIISKFLHKGQFIILESTTYPGTTEEIVVPILEKSGLKSGIDFGVAYSQERIDPGNKKYTVENMPKVVGGINTECTDISGALYNNITPTIIKVRDCRTAEACKLLENIFRSVNIALVNEMALTFEKMGIDVWEVISAAATKPYGFMPFYPGPGIGGHCIPLDPYYLAYKARRYGVSTRFIDLAGEINDFMRLHIVNLAEAGLNKIGKTIRNSHVAIIGLSYKKEINDGREAPSKRIIDEIVGEGASIKVYDPYVKTLVTHTGSYSSECSLDDALRGMDCAIFVVDHERFKKLKPNYFQGLMANPIVIDGRNIFQTDDMNGIIYLAIGKPRKV